MLARFIFAPTTIAVLALTAPTFSSDEPGGLRVAKPEQKSQPAEKPAEKSVAKPTEKTVAKPAEKPTAKQTETPVQKPESKPESKPAEKPAVKQAEKQAEKPPEKPVAKAPEKKLVAERAPAPVPGADGEPAPARAILVTKRELTAQLEIFLDQQLFSPGMIDGIAGPAVTKALKRWQKARGLAETGEVDENVPIDSVYPVYTYHTVKKEEMKFVGDLPGKTAEQATRKYLPYPGYADFLAERYHTNREFLERLNPKLRLGSLKPGDEVRVPNVEPFKLEEMPSTGNFAEDSALASRHVVVTRKETMLDIYEGENLLASVPIAPGSSAHPTPPGKWRIVGIASMPTFRWDAGVLNRGVRTEKFFMLPAGPRNPVGVAWVGLNKPGIGIHGTNNPYSIGTFASHGCMRTANWDISRVSRMLTAGVEVEIK